jgi:hypothetical protein
MLLDPAARADVGDPAMFAVWVYHSISAEGVCAGIGEALVWVPRCRAGCADFRWSDERQSMRSDR